MIQSIHHKNQYGNRHRIGLPTNIWSRVGPTDWFFNDRYHRINGEYYWKLNRVKHQFSTEYYALLGNRIEINISKLVV